MDDLTKSFTPTPPAKALAGTGSVSNPGAAVPELNPPAAEIKGPPPVQRLSQPNVPSVKPGPPDSLPQDRTGLLAARQPLTPATLRLPDVPAFQAHLLGWLEGLRAELPAPAQQHPLDYLAANFDRLSISLHDRLRGDGNAQ